MGRSYYSAVLVDDIGLSITDYFAVCGASKRAPEPA